MPLTRFAIKLLIYHVEVVEMLNFPSILLMSDVSEAICRQNVMEVMGCSPTSDAVPLTHSERRPQNIIPKRK